MIKNIKSILSLLFVLFSIFGISVFANPVTNSYWDMQRKGANIFNQHMTSEIWNEAANANMEAGSGLYNCTFHPFQAITTLLVCFDN